MNEVTSCFWLTKKLKYYTIHFTINKYTEGTSQIAKISKTSTVLQQKLIRITVQKRYELYPNFRPQYFEKHQLG